MPKDESDAKDPRMQDAGLSLGSFGPFSSLPLSTKGRGEKLGLYFFG
jgi:hypothetical protein